MLMLFLLAALPTLGLAVSPAGLSSDALEPRLMRKEAKDEAQAMDLQLSAAGEVVKAGCKHSSTAPNYCMLDFPFGKANQSACETHVNGITDKLIEEKTVCKLAAWRHRASLHLLHENFQEDAPQGCFKAPCSWVNTNKNKEEVAGEPFEEGDDVHVAFQGATELSPARIKEKKGPEGSEKYIIEWTGPENRTTDTVKTYADLNRIGDEKQCFFHNEIGDPPEGTIHGIPVCERNKLVMGKTDSKGGSEAGCEAGFAVIMDETECASAAVCWGKCTDKEFRITTFDRTLYNKHPLGCFLHDVGPGRPTPCVAFNPNLTNSDGSFYTELPTGPTEGKPICNATLLGR